MFSKNKDESKTVVKDKKNAAPSIISTDLNIVGDLSSVGEIHVDGRVEGDIHCRTLIAGINAEIIGSVQVDFAKIYGCLSGHLCARSVFLASTARVIGDITHENLEMESGAFLEGNCRHTDDPIPAEQAPSDLMLTDAHAAEKDKKSANG